MIYSGRGQSHQPEIAQETIAEAELRVGCGW